MPADELWRVPEWFPELNPVQLEKLHFYWSELRKFNNKINLISSHTLLERDQIHFSDSLCACKIIRPHLVTQDIYDFGSGNGFPALIMAILFPELSITVVDRDQRKMEFIKHIAWSTKTSNMNFMVESVQALSPGLVEAAISRGFASINKSLVLSQKALKKNARYFHLKSSHWSDEVAQLSPDIKNEWAVRALKNYQLPETQETHTVIVTERLNA